MALTKEDLLAISQLLDVKLKAEIQPIKNEIQTLRDELQTEIQALRGELQTEIQALRGELQTEVQVLRSELYTVNINLQTEIHQIKMFQEYVIMPHLNTISVCYTSTYHRYKDSVEGYEALLADNEIMKKVIMEHSEKLQKLA